MTREVQETINRLSREQLVRVLEACGFQCYHFEDDALLREALRVNVEDGTISPEMVQEVAK